MTGIVPPSIIGQPTLLGLLKSANMNSTADQLIQKQFNFTTCYIQSIMVTKASTSLTTAAGGVYPAASKGGTAIVAAGQAYSALTAATKTLNLTLAVTDILTWSSLYLALTTGQGSAATADLYVIGYPLS